MVSAKKKKKTTAGTLGKSALLLLLWNTTQRNWKAKSLAGPKKSTSAFLLQHDVKLEARPCFSEFLVSLLGTHFSQSLSGNIFEWRIHQSFLFNNVLKLSSSTLRIILSSIVCISYIFGIFKQLKDFNISCQASVQLAFEANVFHLDGIFRFQKNTTVSETNFLSCLN